MMEKLLSEPSTNDGRVVEGDPLNLRGSYDAPAFQRLGRKLGSEIPFEPPGRGMGSGVMERRS
ncbi:MAG: hypothetical protein HQL79_10480 [Magnetococcales bacterium]|nr:hypothetical protein [Magnetococcales bacterium]